MWDKVIRCSAVPSVWILPANSDNFAYLIIDADSKEAAVVDGVCVDEIEAILAQEQAYLKYVLTTHHHADHSSGDVELRKRHPDVGDGKNGGALGSKLRFVSIPTPAHTMDHLCFYFTDSQDPTSPPFVFTGDFLFQCGCGYFFEGTPKDFEASVRRLYDTCDEERTLMFYGHEYSESNFKFAENFEPKNELLSQARQKTSTLLPAPLRTPSSLREELSVNPFVRAVLSPDTIPEHHREAASKRPDGALCGYVREAKNNFKK